MSNRKLRSVFPASQLVLILMAILVAYLAFDFGRQVISSQQVQKELHQIEGQIGATLEQQEGLKKQLEYSQSDAAAEAWARQQGWVKENEVPVVIVAPTSASGEVAPTGEGSSSGSDSALDAWWDLFFGSR
jgi:cell division protein FtsB